MTLNNTRQMSPGKPVRASLLADKPFIVRS